MSVSLIKPSFASGELSPSLYGRVDLSKWQTGASVMRNLYVNYRGGASSRAGTKFVGQSKAPGSGLPPRLIPFRFSVYQNYILEFGNLYMRVIANGGYVTKDAVAISSVSQTDPCVISAPGHSFSNGDWVVPVDVGGMTEINGRTFVAQGVVAATSFQLYDTFGNAVDARYYNPFTSGGSVSKIFTLVTPYGIADLPYLKYTQSADVMSLCLVNQQTNTEYETQELTRHSASNWTISPPSIGTAISAPGTPSVSASTTGTVAYGYVVTAVNASGQESQASPIGVVTSAVNISATAGTITVNWTAVPGAVSYNVYKTTPDFVNAGNFTGQLFGYVGSSQTATHWQDTNFIPDYTTTPPLAENPFSGSGNAPGSVAYFQQRRAYGGSLNAPDTYHFSQPGAYTNFDSADPPIDSDSITGTPWAQQVNGIQFMVPMPGGLLVFTGLDAWQLSGTGGAGTPITPAQQSAQPQESYGCSPTIEPIRIGYHILYVQTNGNIVQDMEYNFWNNMYAGTDISILSSHLFNNYQIVNWALARQPYKIIWSVRNDGKLLSLTYMKEQEVAGWARHDTNGLFCGVAVATEPPVDAPYFVVKRYISGESQWAYYIERMDNRQWPNVETCWCVDAGLSLPMPEPTATLTASAAEPSYGCKAGLIINGGSNYSSAVTGRIIDRGGTGSGAVVQSVTTAGGVITGYVISPEGAGYSRPVIEFTDATGSGAIAQVLVDESVTFNADAAVFSSGDVGSVIRMGGGRAQITEYVNSKQVIADVLNPITTTVPDDPNDMPVPATAGTWTLTAPVTSVAGLDHLEGMAVTGLADGAVIPPTVVENGQINLSQPASAIVIGLGFTAQLQSMHTDIAGEQTVQGKAKKIVGVTVRVEASRDFSMGQDRPIASAQQNQAEYPWTDLSKVQNRNPPAPSTGPVPLYTGDRYVNVKGGWNQTGNTPNDSVPMPMEAIRANGMVACEQPYPLPLNVLAFVPVLEISAEGGSQ